jgi:hypothetical protein
MELEDRSPALAAPQWLALLVALLLGASLAASLMPSVFQKIPTDVSRIGFILEAAREASFSPDIAVFGNSVIMSAIDGGQLGRSLGGETTAVNLASTGQSLVESFLLQQDLPEGVRTRVQLVALAPRGSEGALDPQKYNAFYLYGFRPAPATHAALARAYGEPVTGILERSDLAQRIAGRWALRQLVDTQLRMLLRRDLTLAAADRDLQHPQRYSAAVSPARLARMLETERARLAAGPLELSMEKRTLLVTMRDGAAAAGARLVALLPPIHPAVAELAGGALERAVGEARAALEADGIAVVDATGTLAAEHFVDTLHPTNAGAERVTEQLARALGGRR